MQDCVKRIECLRESGRLCGVLDDRGRFLCITKEEMQQVAEALKRLGAFTKETDLVNVCNRIIKLTPSEQVTNKICMHVCLHACKFACMRVCMHACMRVRVHTNMHACMFVCTLACMFVCMHACNGDSLMQALRSLDGCCCCAAAAAGSVLLLRYSAVLLWGWLHALGVCTGQSKNRGGAARLYASCRTCSC